MKLLEVVAVGIRILGILLLWRVASGLLVWLANLDQVSTDSISTTQLIVLYALPLLISLLLIKVPVRLAKLLTPTASELPPDLSGDGAAIQCAGLIILGAYFLGMAIPDFFYNLIFIIYFTDSDINNELPRLYVDELITMLELAIGLYLMLGAKGLVRWLAQLRTAGLKEAS